MHNIQYLGTSLLIVLVHTSLCFLWTTSLKFLVYKDKESIQPMPGGIYLGYWFLAAVYDAL